MPKDQNDYTNQFNTKLSPQDEVQFQGWARKNNKLRDLYDYDLRGFWKNSQGVDARGHGTDLYKKPNHPTFSNESMYHSSKLQGGAWGQDPSRIATVFTPSQQMIANRNRMQSLQGYMQKYEPDVVLNPGIQMGLPMQLPSIPGTNLGTIFGKRSQ